MVQRVGLEVLLLRGALGSVYEASPHSKSACRGRYPDGRGGNG